MDGFADLEAQTRQNNDGYTTGDPYQQNIQMEQLPSLPNADAPAANNVLAGVASAERSHFLLFALGTLVVVVSILLQLAFVLSFFAHPIADDYSFAAKGREIGGIMNTWDSYTRTSGRWSTIWIVSTVLGMWNPLVSYPFVLWSFFAVTLLSFYLLWRVLAPGEGRRCEHCFLSGATAVLLWGAMSSGMQIVYWVSAVVQYQLSIAFAIILVSSAILLSRRTLPRTFRGLTLCVLGVMAAMAAGMLELTGITLLTIAVLGLFEAVISRSRRIEWLVIVISAAVGLAVLVLSPGVAGRASLYSGSGDMSQDTLSRAFSYGLGCLSLWLRDLRLIPLILAFAFCARLGTEIPSKQAYLRAFIRICLLAGTFLCPLLWVLITFIVMSPQEPFPRVLDAAHALFLLGVIITLSTWTPLVRRYVLRPLRLYPRISLEGVAYLILAVALVWPLAVRICTREVFGTAPAWHAFLHHRDTLAKQAATLKYTNMIFPEPPVPVPYAFYSSGPNAHSTGGASLAHFAGVPRTDIYAFPNQPAPGSVINDEYTLIWEDGFSTSPSPTLDEWGTLPSNELRFRSATINGVSSNALEVSVAPDRDFCVAQHVVVQPGVVYVLKGFVRADNAKGTAVLEVTDAQKGWQSYAIQSQDSVRDSAPWRELTLWFGVPEHVRLADIRLRYFGTGKPTDASGVVAFTRYRLFEAKLEPLEWLAQIPSIESATGNLLSNGSFDAPPQAYGIAGWDSGLVRVLLDPTSRVDGSTSLRAGIASNVGMTISQTIKLPDCRSYLLKGWVRTEAVRGAAFLEVRDANTNAAIGVSQPVSATSDWTFVQLNFVVPPEVSQIRVLLTHMPLSKKAAEKECSISFDRCELFGIRGSAPAVPTPLETR